MKWKRIASGDYESTDGRFIMWRVPDVYPPAWNVEDKASGEPIVDGAATMKDAIWFADQEITNA